jgi:hypothetical protein
LRSEICDLKSEVLKSTPMRYSSLLIALLLTPGCSQDDGLPDTTPVRGTVTYQGKPVAGAVVTFLTSGPTTSPPATGTTTADGTFELTTFKNSDGAVPGSYLVGVSKFETVGLDPNADDSMEAAAARANAPPPQTRSLLPEKYADPARSGLTFEVKEGETNEYKIELR